MENASQALLIAGTILIAMMVLSVGVYLVSRYSNVGNSYEETRMQSTIVSFNTNFTKFEGRTDVTAQELVTLKKFAKSYDAENGTKTEVIYPGSNNDDINFIKENSIDENGHNIYFKYTDESIKYNQTTGKIESIRFEKN